MCVFVSISQEIAELEKRFKAEANKNVSYKPVFYASAFANPELPVICQADQGRIDFYEWGLIPFWVKDEDTARKLRINTVNAKAETLTEKPSFRHTIMDRRCIIPADGFYEFQEVNGKKYPWFIRLKNTELFAFAGLTDTWTNRSNGKTIKSFTLITVEANPMMAEIHNRKKRMPAILTPDDEKLWLNKDSDQSHAMEVLRPFDENRMEAWTVANFLKNKDIDPYSSRIMEKLSYPGLSGNASSLF